MRVWTFSGNCFQIRLIENIVSTHWFYFIIFVQYEFRKKLYRGAFICFIECLKPPSQAFTCSQITVFTVANSGNSFGWQFSRHHFSVWPWICSLSTANLSWVKLFSLWVALDASWFFPSTNLFKWQASSYTMNGGLVPFMHFKFILQNYFLFIK